LKAANVPVPSSVVIEVAGWDSSGTAWSQQISVPFLAQPTGTSN